MTSGISVVVPAYNAKKYISASLASLQEQTIRDLEIIVVDDGSSDGTADIARQALAASKHPWHVVTRPHAGVSAARNYGLSIASGQYVMFVDADDYLHPECLSALVGAMEETEADMVFCGHDVVSDDRAVIRRYADRYSYIQSPTPGVEALVSVMREIVLPWTGSTAYRKRFLEATGVRFNEDRTYAEDIEFIWTALFRAGRVACVDRVLSFYVQHAGSITSTATMARFQGLDVLFSLLDRFSQSDPNSAAVECLRTYRLPVDIAGLFGALAGQGIRFSELMSVLDHNPRYREALRNFRSDLSANLASRRATQVRMFLNWPRLYLCVSLARAALRRTILHTTRK